MPAQPNINLTGLWTADDQGTYYIRHLSDNSIWWAALHGWWEFHQGIRYTNVFHGVVDPNRRTIEGEWADVPRGFNLLHGHLSLDIIIEEQEADVLEIPPNGPPGDGNGGRPPRSRITLRKRSETGGFGPSSWEKAVAPILESNPIGHYFDIVRRNDGENMRHQVTPYRDFTVVFGDIRWEATLNWSSTLDGARDYCTFITRGGGPFGTNFDEKMDGDLDFVIELDRQNLDTQPGPFWEQTSDWLAPAANIRARLNSAREGLPPNHLRAEAIMYGGSTGFTNCNNPELWLPGWRQSFGNSMLLNGLPIGGSVFSGSAGEFQRPDVEIRLAPLNQIPDQIPIHLKPQPLSRVRVTGVLALDQHEENMAEIHPVYAIDLIQPFESQARPQADLTGAWHADDVGTYYLRQVERNTLWWLGLSRDQGRAFANVFHGTIQGSTIRGQWADISLGNARSNGELVLVDDGRGAQAIHLTAQVKTGGFSGSAWQKLYDRPYVLFGPYP